MRRRYLLFFIWSLSLIFYLYQYVARASIPNVLNNELMAYFNIDMTSVCALFSAFYLIYMCMQIPVGYLLDKFGTKYIAFFSVISCAFGLFIFILTKNYSIALLGQILVGIGSSFAFILSLKLAEEMFPQSKLPMMSAILNSSGAFGAFFMSPVVAKLSGVFAITTIIYSMSIIGIILAFLLLFFVRQRKKVAQITKSDVVKKIKKIMQKKEIIFISVNSMLMYSVVVVFADHFGVAYMRATFDVSIVEASWMCSMIYVGIILGSPVFAVIANAFHSYKTALMSGSILSFLIICILLFADLGTSSASIFMFLLGATISSQVMSFPAAMSFVTHDMSATTSSVVNTITTLSGVIIYPMVGFILDLVHTSPGLLYSKDEFRTGFSLLIVILALSIAVLCLLKNHSQEESPEKVT